MRTRRTLAPHTSRPRAIRLRRLVAALLAAPLALGTLAATALPAAAETSISGEAPESDPGATTLAPSAPADPQPTSESPAEIPVAGPAPESQSPAGDPATGTVPSDEVPPADSESPVENPPVNSESPDEQTSNPTAPVVSDPVDPQPTPPYPYPYPYPTVPHPVIPTPTVPSTPESNEPVVTKTTPEVTFETSSQLTTNSVLVAKVSGGTNAAMPTGKIQFLYNDKDSLGSALIIDGEATLQLRPGQSGSYTVRAYYSGSDDAHYSQASSDPRSFTIYEVIEHVGAPVEVKISAPEKAEGPKVKASVSVTGLRHETRMSVTEAYGPGGTVTMSFGYGEPQTAPVENGLATFELEFPKPGSYTITAKYSGDKYFSKGEGVAPIQIVGRDVPPVTPVTPVITVPAKITTTVGTAATITVGLPTENRPAALRVTGTRAPIDVAVPASGPVTVTLPVLAPGTHEVVVQTAASETLNGTEHAVRVIVSGEPARGSSTPDADLTGSTTTLVTGKKITLVARDFQPGETVAFYLHSDPVFLGTAEADENGVATLVVALPAGVPAGQHHVQATGGTSGRWAEIPVTVTEGTPALETPAATGPIATVPVAAPVAPAAPAPAVAAPAAPVSVAAVTAAPLAATGAELGSTALLVSVLLGSGALLLAGRRRLTRSAR